MLAEIVKQTGSVRTLGEILHNYKANSKKYEFDSHPDRPIKPLLPQHLYMHENKEKLTQKFEKDNPGMSKFTFVSTFKRLSILN